jgi:lysophospholipase L1-like esterase
MPAEKWRLGGLDNVLMFHPARSRLRIMSQLISRLSRKGMVSLIVFFVFLLGTGVRDYFSLTVSARPQDWESSIRKFEDDDRLNPPKAGGIVFAGASSIRLWGTLLEEMKPLDVTNRGFGGSQYSDLNHFAQRIVMAYHPRAVVVYEGDNDLAAGSPKTPEMVANDAREFVRIVHSQLPETWIYIMSIKPSYLRWNEWPQMKTANKLIQDFVKTQDRVQYLDVATPMFYGQDKPPRDLFVEDGLHPTAKCYALWTSIIKPELLHQFGPRNNVSGDAVAPLWFEFGVENAMPSVR